MRTRKITRTMRTRKVKALVFNPETHETSEQEFTIPSSLSEKMDILRKCQKMYNDENKQIVDVLSTFTKVEKYTMDEDVYIANAELIYSDIEEDSDEYEEEYTEEYTEE